MTVKKPGAAVRERAPRLGEVDDKSLARELAVAEMTNSRNIDHLVGSARNVLPAARGRFTWQ